MNAERFMMSDTLNCNAAFNFCHCEFDADYRELGYAE
jgi:hypothetical protein